MLAAVVGSLTRTGSQRITAGVCLMVASLCCGTSHGDEPLHARIDQIIAQQAETPLARMTTDAEFVRRVYLDLAGRIPDVQETRDFLADTTADKRTHLIDRLLKSDEYPLRMRELFHVMLMERRGTDPEWDTFLLTAFQQNKPWDWMARQMLKADIEDEKTRGAAYFLSKRLEKYGQNPTDYPGLTQDVGRLFLGVDLQCAQCHNHPHVDDYKQVDFQGLFVVFSNLSLRRDVEFPAVSEKPLAKKLEFTSVFTAEMGETGPRLPFGMEVMIEVFKKGEEYITPPDRKTRFPGIPRYSPLAELAERLPSAENKPFNRNMANRLWFVMMGRGIVDPLDLAHSDNPPSHPELLDLLAAEFAAHQFDIRWFLRELALSRTYQRATVLPEGGEDAPPESFTVGLERPLSAEQMLASMRLALGVKTEATVADVRANADLLKKFQAAFANAARDPEVEFSPTLRAAMFVLNEETVLGWLKPADDNLIDRVSKLDDDEQVARELYLAILSREPTDGEVAEVKTWLAARSDRRTVAMEQVAWALLASTEFCLNH